MGIVLAIVFFLLAAGLLFLLAFFLPSKIGRKGKFLISEPNLLAGETLENPCPGVKSASLEYLRGIDGNIPEHKAKSKAVLTWEEGHNLIAIGFIYFKKKKEALVPVGTAYFSYEEPFRMEETEEFVFPKGTAGLALVTRRLDEERDDQAPLAKPKILWLLLAALVGAVGIALSAMVGYLGVLCIFGGTRIFEYAFANMMNMILVAAIGAGAGFIAEFLAMFFYGRSKGYRGK